MHHDFLRINSEAEISLSLPVPPAGLRWSKAVWKVRKDKWTALYRPLNLALVYFKNGCRSDSANSVLQDRLIEERFWIPENSQWDKEEHRKLIVRARSGKFRFICILPTTDCDYSCLYCHQRRSNGSGVSMTMNEIVSGMNKCADLCTDFDKPLDILIYGGEPLKAFPLSEKIIELSAGANRIFKQEVRISFTTSGHGLQKRQAELLAQNDAFVILSLDAPQEINDSVRYCQNGDSSYNIAVNAFEMLKTAGCRVGLSVTIGRHNYENFASNLSRLLDDIHPDDIGLNAFLHPVKGRANPFQLNAKEAFEALINGIEITGKSGIYAEQPFRRFKPFIHRNPLLKDCSSPGERIVLVPGGKIGFCDSCYTADEYFYSYNDFPIDNSNSDYNIWSSLSSPELPDCGECPAMTVCGGACRYDAYIESGRLNGVSKNRCAFEKMMLDWMIWELHRLAGSENADYFLPSVEDRQLLMSNIRPTNRNQPFTAGSYLVN